MSKTSIATAGLGALGIFIVGSLGWDAAQMAAAASPPKAAATVVQGGTPHIYLTIATPDMLVTEVGPAVMPSSFTFPAHSDVILTVTNFDDATALPAGSEQYAIAEGTSGPLSIQSMDPADPNAAVTTRTVDRLDSATGVSHTFTIAKLGLNVPIAPKSRTTFTFHTGAAGSYDWQCMDPCGSGPTGWDGAMSTKGYMIGQVTAGSCCCCG
jgi:hypothetical protein